VGVAEAGLAEGKKLSVTPRRTTVGVF
jgi:hypothetical protein